MPANSWKLLESEDSEYYLTQKMRNKDPFTGSDIGWVSQMRPLIKEFTQEGDLVLDPFAGLGTTLIAAAVEGRVSIGVEREEMRVGLIYERWKEFSLSESKLKLHSGSCVEILRNFLNEGNVPEISLSLSSVPYFNSAWKGSNQKGQLYAERDYVKYLNYFSELCYLLRKIVKPEGFIIMIAENIRDVKGRLLPIAWDIFSVMQHFFDTYDERIIVYNKSHKISGFPELHTNRSHEYVFIAQNKLPDLNKEDGLLFLKDLSEHFDFILYGGFRDLLKEDKEATTDIDILLENKIEIKKELINYLTQRGFLLFSEHLVQILVNEEVEKVRYVRGCSKQLRQIDVVFLDEAELQKIPTGGASFRYSKKKFILNEDWVKNRAGD